MKKVIVIVAAFVMVFAGNVFAGAPSVSEIVVTKNSGTLNEGYNRVIVTGGGTLVFYKERDRFSDVVFYDEAGNATELRAGNCETFSTRSSGEYNPIAGACFGSADGSTSVQFYESLDISDDSDPNEILIALLLPAVQAAREAARR